MKHDMWMDVPIFETIRQPVHALFVGKVVKLAIFKIYLLLGFGLAGEPNVNFLSTGMPLYPCESIFSIYLIIFTDMP